MLTLILLNPDPSQKPRTFHLVGDRPEVIGRQGQAVTLPDSRISRRHAEASVQNGTWVVRDLGSSNGTWVNGQRITSMCELEEGDRLQVGRLTLIVGHVEVVSTPQDALMVTEQDLDADDTAIGAADVAAVVQTAADEAEPADALGAANDLDEALSASFVESKLEDVAEDLVVNEPQESSLAAADLEAGEAADESGSDDSSIAPSGELPSAAPLSEQEIQKLDGAGFDELDDDDFDQLAEELFDEESDDEDEYTESAGAITPVVVRPESPIDPTRHGASKPAGELVPEADPVDENAAEPLIAAQHDEPTNHANDHAPEVVGLSLDMPAPEVSESEPDDDLPSSAPQNASAAPDDDVPLKAVAIDDALDEAIDDGMSAEFLASLDEGNDTPAGAAAIPPEAVTGAAFLYDSTAAPDTDETPEPQAQSGLADPEAMQEIAGQIKPRRGWWKAAALLLIAAGAGGGWYVAEKMSSPTNITGTGTTPQAAAEQAAPLPDNTPASPHSEIAALPSPATNRAAQAPAVLEPTPSDRLAEAASALPQDDPFGDAPILTPREDLSTNTPAPQATGWPTADEASDGNLEAAAPRAPVEVADRIDGLETTAATVPQDEATETEPAPALAMLVPNPESAWVPAGPAEEAVDITEVSPADALEPADEENPQVVESATAAAGRRIAFLVDASGSMVDSMNQGVLTWLEGKLLDLHEQDEFTVIFFRSGEVFEAQPVGIKRAENTARQEVIAWMSPEAGNIQPRGKSDPVDALRLAREYDATELYILSDDKFGDRGMDVASIDVRDIAGFWVGQDVTFHTVKFYYGKNDEDKRLQAIARRFGGEYEFVEEPPFDRTPGGLDLFSISQ